MGWFVKSSFSLPVINLGGLAAYIFLPVTEPFTWLLLDSWWRISVDLLSTVQGSGHPSRQLHSWAALCVLPGAAGRALWIHSSLCLGQGLVLPHCFSRDAGKLAGSWQNQSRNASAPVPVPWTPPKGHLWVIFPLKEVPFLLQWGPALCNCLSQKSNLVMA